MDNVFWMQAHVDGISFYNSMWLVANDIIIGLAIGSFLTTNRYIMSYLLHKLLHVRMNEGWIRVMNTSLTCLVGIHCGILAVNDVMVSGISCWS